MTEKYVETGRQKANYPVYKLLVLGILAGAYIAFASEGSNMAIHTIESIGLAKTLAGALFSTGLMMVIITGAELFTGNTLMVISCLEKRCTWHKLITNWSLVYLGNFIGSMLVVGLIILSGQFDSSSGLLGGFTIKLAAHKIAIPFSSAFFMGILCNWLVCAAVWMAGAAKDIAGKLLSIFFPIWLFITSGFEHCIANMYYIPAGILAKSNPVWAGAAASLGVTDEMLANLTWRSFISNSLIPVTLGNIVGGAVFVGFAYWLAFIFKPKKKKVATSILTQMPTVAEKAVKLKSKEMGIFE